MSSISNTPQISMVITMTPDLPIEEPDNSLSMRDEHLSTISETESDEVIKSSVKSLVPIPSESEVTSDNESDDDKSLSNKDVSMENFKIYSNHLYNDEEIISTKIDPHYFNAESNLLESLLNQDTMIDSSPKFNYLLKEFSGKLAHIDLMSPGIKEADFDLEEEIRLVENLLYDNSSPRPPEELNTEIDDLILESLSLNFISPGIYFLEELLSNDPLPIPENESSNFDHDDDPSFPRPPLEPPDVEVFFDFEPDMGVLTTKVVKGISEHYVLMPNILPTLPTLDPNLDFTLSHDSLGSKNKIFDPGIFIEVQSERLLSREEFSISFIHDPLYPVFDTLLPSSFENKEKVFKPGILFYFLVSHQDKTTSDFFENPMMMYGGDIPLLDILIALDLEASRARGFVHRLIEPQSLAYGDLIS
nr:hypothetical protein [Tanacetum cinerariifolium]